MMTKRKRKSRKQKIRIVVKEKGNGNFHNVSKNFVNMGHILFIDVYIIQHTALYISGWLT